MNLEFSAAGIDDSALTSALETAASRALFATPGRWRIVLNPADERGQWILDIQRRGRHESMTMTAPEEGLAAALEQRLRKMADADCRRPSRFLQAVAKGVERSERTSKTTERANAPADSTFVPFEALDPTNERDGLARVTLLGDVIANAARPTLPLRHTNASRRLASVNEPRRRRRFIQRRRLALAIACGVVTVIVWTQHEAGQSGPAPSMPTPPSGVIAAAAQPLPTAIRLDPRDVGTATARVPTREDSRARDSAQPLPTAIRLDPRDVGTATARVPTREDSRARDSKSAGVPALAPWLSPRLATLKVKPSWHASAIGIEDQLLLRDLQQSLSLLWINHVAPTNDAIFLGVSDAADLARLGTLKRALNPGGVLWVFYRRSASMSESDLVATARAATLLPTKAIRFSATHDAAAFTDSSSP